jgi:hypothetical protein
MKVAVTVLFLAPIKDPTVGILIRNHLGLDIFGTNTTMMRQPLGEYQSGERLTLTWGFQNRFGAGEYTITSAVHRDRTHLEECFDWLDRGFSFRVIPNNDLDHLGVVRLDPHMVRHSEVIEPTDFEATLESIFDDSPADIIPANTANDRYSGLLNGWYSAESHDDESFVWSQGVAGFILRPASNKLTINAAAYGRAPGDPDVQLTIKTGQSQSLGTAKWIAGGREIQVIDLPDECLGKPVLFQWIVEPAMQIGGRELGLALYGLTTTVATDS